MKVNGKEYGLFYSVGARLDYEAWVVKHPDAPMSAAYLQQAIYMSQAYAAIHGGDALTMEELVKLPNSAANAIIEAAREQERIDSGVTVEAESKNAKKAGK